MVERHLAKVNVASSTLVSRSMAQAITSSLCCMPCYQFPPMAGHFYVRSPVLHILHDKGPSLCTERGRLFVSASSEERRHNVPRGTRVHDSQRTAVFSRKAQVRLRLGSSAFLR